MTGEALRAEAGGVSAVDGVDMVAADEEEEQGLPSRDQR